MFNEIGYEYLVEEKSTLKRYCVVPVRNTVNGGWSSEALIMIVKYGRAVRCAARLVSISELDDIFPTDEYTVLDYGVHIKV